jgi:hypothetical protein
MSAAVGANGGGRVVFDDGLNHRDTEAQRKT